VRKRLASIGTSVSDTKADTMMASATTTANSWNSSPITPGMKKIGDEHRDQRAARSR
jgi:hypothetical protein